MPKLATQHFHDLEYTPESVFHFAAGIPGFEEHTDFIFISQQHTAPLVYMQSVKDPRLCLIGLPASVVDPEYRLELTPEEAIALGLPYTERPAMGREIFCLVLLTFAQDAPPVANLMSPIVVNLENHRGIQAIQVESGYSLRHPLGESVVATCS